MKKRTALFRVLKSKFIQSTKSGDFQLICILICVVIGGIIGFNTSKVEPIPLTEDEINYYTSQAEIGLNRGISYLDEGTMFITDSYNPGTAKVYTNNQPAEKQKLKFLYYNNEIVETELYYSYSFFGIRILGAIIVATLSFIVSLIIIPFLEWIIKKVISIRKEMLDELKKYNSEINENY